VSSRVRILEPTGFDPALYALFSELTGEHSDHWALRGGVMIRRYQKLHGRSPTFRELFDELMQLPGLVDLASRARFPDIDKPVAFSFMHHVAVHWRRERWVIWDSTPRSIRVGSRFAEESRRWRQERGAPRALGEKGGRSVNT